MFSIVLEGKSTSFNCQSFTIPTWSFNNNRYLPEEVRKYDNGTLYIEYAMRLHQGQYECQGKYGGNQKTFIAQSILKVRGDESYIY